jgi:hypothetical protein
LRSTAVTRTSRLSETIVSLAGYGLRSAEKENFEPPDMRIGSPVFS